jgi:hypothetical protein
MKSINGVVIKFYGTIKAAYKSVYNYQIKLTINDLTQYLTILTPPPPPPPSSRFFSKASCTIVTKSLKPHPPKSVTSFIDDPLI